MGKFSAPRSQVDVTYVKRGQMDAIAQRPAQPSQRAQAAIARAAERRGSR